MVLVSEARFRTQFFLNKSLLIQMILRRGMIFAATLLLAAEKLAAKGLCFHRGFISPRRQGPSIWLPQGRLHHKYYRKLKHWNRDNCDCISDDYKEESSGLASVPIHVNRRKFIQYTSSIPGLFAFSMAIPRVNAAENDEKSIIAVPISPLAPFSTTRTYRTIVLANGLQVVLVKDSQAQRSSVALTVDGAGQFSDPYELPGLAHLMVRHLVILTVWLSVLVTFLLSFLTLL